MKIIIIKTLLLLIVFVQLFTFAACSKKAEAKLEDIQAMQSVAVKDLTPYERLTGFIVSNGTEIRSASSVYEYSLLSDRKRTITVKYIPITDQLTVNYDYLNSGIDTHIVTTFDIGSTDTKTLTFDTNLWVDSYQCHLRGETSKLNMSSASEVEIISMVPEDYAKSDYAASLGMASVIESLDNLNRLMTEEGLGSVSDFGYSDQPLECVANSTVLVKRELQYGT